MINFYFLLKSRAPVEMNAGELTRLRQKAAVRYIARTNVTDSSLLTWKKQVGPTYADSGTPPVVANRGINAGTGVMEFANGNSSDLPRGNALYDSNGTLNFATGKGVNGESLRTIFTAAGCAVSSDPDPATNPNGITLPCFTYETRQRYQLVSTNGVVLDNNTFLSNINLCGPPSGYFPTPLQTYGPSSNPTYYKNIYGGGDVFPRTGFQDQLKDSFPSN
jgi:hypothetical protein